MYAKIDYPRKYQLMMFAGGLGCIFFAGILYVQASPEPTFDSNSALAMDVYLLWIAFALTLGSLGILTITNYIISKLFPCVSISDGIITTRGPFGWPRSIKAQGSSISIGPAGEMLVMKNGHTKAKALRGTFERPISNQFISVATFNGVEVNFE